MKKFSKYQPIGIFDSGIGGLTVANAIKQALPKEELVYFGDTANLPYGDKSIDVIRYYCIRITKFLLEKNCKMVVIACNTASAAAYGVLTDFFKGEVVFVNVIDPLVDFVVQKNYKKIGIIATKATVNTDIYNRKILENSPTMDVKSLATPLLAPMIEEGFIQNKISDVVLKEYLSNKDFKKIEAMLLACTHYPLIKPNIIKFFNGKVAILDSTDVVTTAVIEKLEKAKLLNDKGGKKDSFYVSDFTDSFQQTTKLFYKNEIKLEQVPIWK